MMNINKLCVGYYSPTHTSRRIAHAVAEGMNIARREIIDLTTDKHTEDITVNDAICIMAVPVYGGLIAPVAAQRLRRLQGKNSVAVPIVVYGNRDYEDALVQLRDILNEQGFTSLCGAAFIGEHSYSRQGMPIAEGRPDSDDIAIAKAFGLQALAKLTDELKLTTDCETIDTTNKDFSLKFDKPLNELISVPHMKGNTPYKTLRPATPQAPVVNENCYGCGDCVDWCPTGAISIINGHSTTEIGLCTKCCACVKLCPVGGRTFDSPYTAILHEKCAERREPELFL